MVWFFYGALIGFSSDIIFMIITGLHKQSIYVKNLLRFNIVAFLEMKNSVHNLPHQLAIIGSRDSALKGGLLIHMRNCNE